MSGEKIAALKKLPNLGEKCAHRIFESGVETPEQLSTLGPEEVFLRIFEKHGWQPGMCSCFLYAIEGAITGEKWNEISDTRKKELRDFVHAVRASFDPRKK
ncbi:competence protein TfoX [bacterium]|jgi:DNA transformation protein and related proteins|nr:competence protein TfoX [bacterium]MBT6832282.1 competence protein TfoX [bacterium]MBT6996219.1 competence protein TfoX [bacterium]MBT7772466.1 competence protein TfoX [bacterium]